MPQPFNDTIESKYCTVLDALILSSHATKTQAELVSALGMAVAALLAAATDVKACEKTHYDHVSHLLELHQAPDNRPVH